MTRWTRRSFVVGVAAAAAAWGADEDPAPYQDSEAYAVYSALLAQDWTLRIVSGKKLVIQAECIAPDMCEQDMDARGNPEVAAAIASFRQLAAKQLRLLPRLRIDAPYELMDRDKAAKYLAEAATGVRRGVIALAPVGFNRSKTVALTAVSYSCGEECAGGASRFLRKAHGRWSNLTGRPPGCLWLS